MRGALEAKHAAMPDATGSISARLDRLPAARPLWMWVAQLSFGGFFEIYEIALTSLLAPALVAAGIFHKGKGGLFGLPDLATFGAATFAGLFVGALLFSVFADRIGRRPIFTCSLIWYAATTAIMSSLSTASSLCLWRFIASVGIGAEIVAIDAYLAEMMPKRMRGRGFAISTSLQFTAVPVAGVLATVLAHRHIGQIAGWRFLLLFPVLGAVLIWFVRRSLPESPRWLAQHGREEQADRILTAVERKVEHATGQLLPVPVPVLPVTQSEASFADLFRGQLLRRTLMLTVVSIAISFAYFGFGNWLPSLLEARGVTVTKSLLYTALIAISYPVAPLLFSSFADRLGRKWQIVAGGLIVVISGLLFAHQSTAAGWLATGLLLTLGNNLASYAIHAYRSELFPTAVRARAIGFIYSLDRLFTSFNSFIIGFLLIHGGVTGVLIFVSGVSLITMSVTAWFGPETNGRSSEEIGSGLSVPAVNLQT